VSKKKHRARAKSLKTPLAMLEDIQNKRLDPRDLDPAQRRSCLLLLRSTSGKHTSAELASLFDVSPAQIRRDLREIDRELGAEVKAWTLDEVLGSLVSTAERCSVMALKQEDAGLAWSIERDKVKMLKDLGVIEHEQDKSAITITVESIGKGYERARDVLAKTLDPITSGVQQDLDPDQDPLALLEDHGEEEEGAPGR
jgi:hypothetical protein